MDLTAVLKEIDTWPAEDQEALVQQVWGKLADSGWVPTLTDVQKLELDRRIDDLEAHPEDVVTWEQIVDHVRRQR